MHEAARPPSGAAQAPPPADAPARVSRPAGLDPATWRQTLVVAAVIALLFYGSQIVNEALPAVAVGQSQPGAPIDIGDGTRITPLDGWAASRHEGDADGVRLEKGIVVLDLYPETFGSNAGELARGYLDQLLTPAATSLTTSDIEVLAALNGTPGARFRYQGMFTGIEVAIEGEVTAFHDGSSGVLADAWTRQGSLHELLGEVHAMLETVEVGP